MIKYKQWIKETLQNNIVNYNNIEYLHVHKWLIKDLSQRNLMMVIREFPESEGGGFARLTKLSSGSVVSLAKKWYN